MYQCPLFLTPTRNITMKHTFLILLTLLIVTSSNAQFYYSDILLTKTANENYNAYKSKKVKKIISANNLDNETTDENVSVVQTFNTTWTALKTETILANEAKSSSTTTYENNKIVKKIEEGKNINSVVSYEYDNDGKLNSIFTSSDDTSVNKGFNEKHIWYYNSATLPIKMLKIKNNIDTTIVVFLTDEQNNIAEERWMKKGEIIEAYYYYYNEKKQLTDLVKFNLKVEKMLPEFLFEYDASNKLLQMTQIPFGSSNYFVWKYTYNENGFKDKEFCFNKQGKLQGKMEYTYSY